MDPLDVDTPHGPARAHVHLVDDARAGLLLGHGAGGSVQAPDLQRVTRAATAAGFAVVLVEQPYRVAGKRSTPRPPVLDAGWLAVVEQLRGGPLAGRALVFGGRSSGARVACRTAAGAGAAGALALAFPLQPPTRATAKEPAPSRQDELDAARVPVLVVQGEGDRFGVPAPDAARDREVVVVRGDHGLKRDLDQVAAAAVDWLGRVTGR